MVDDDAGGAVLGGHYDVLGVVGRGTRTVVYRARDRRSGRLVAIKRLSGAAARDPEYSERLIREHSAMTTLAGTAAVRVEGLVAGEDGGWCLVMELLEGCDFEAYLAHSEGRGARLGVTELVKILSPIVDTLEVAHQKGIVHRDLKPANVYVVDGRLGSVRLLDFGVAKLAVARPLTQANTVMGSPSYIAPEVWAMDEGSDHRVDIYSLGAIVFRALSGRVPFQGSLQEKIEQALRGPRPSLHALRADLPRDVDVWVEQVLAVEPDRRFWNVRAMWNALCELLGLDAWPPQARTSTHG